MTSLAAVVIAASAVVAQAEGPPSNYEHLKPMEWLIGSWRATTEAEQDIPGVVEKGDSMNLLLNFEWGLNNNVVLVHIAVKANGETMFESRGIDGWDPEDQRVVGFGFNSLGGRVINTFEFEKDQIILRGRSVGSDGAVEEAVTHIAKKGEDGMVSHRSKITRDGESQPDDPELEWKRVKRGRRGEAAEKQGAKKREKRKKANAPGLQ